MNRHLRRIEAKLQTRGYRTEFRHVNPGKHPEADKTLPYRGRVVSAITECSIHPPEGTHPANGSEGIAACSTRDQFCKRTGREIAFRRAFEALPLCRDQRKELMR